MSLADEDGTVQGVSLADEIRRGAYQSIVLLSGAGVSTGAGIPDYRGTGSGEKAGLFSTIGKEYFSNSKVADDHPALKQFHADILAAEPTAAHHLAPWLDERGWLKRVYTQNIDSLYVKAGLSDEKIVEFHGSLAKNNVVMYGDDISEASQAQVIQDLVHENDCDLMLVMGTSLQVSPFVSIPNLVGKDCVRALVDLNPTAAMNNNWSPSRRMDGMGLRSWVKFERRRVTLRPLWSDKKRFKAQHIIQADTNAWASEVMREDAIKNYSQSSDANDDN